MSITAVTKMRFHATEILTKAIYSLVLQSTNFLNVTTLQTVTGWYLHLRLTANDSVKPVRKAYLH